VRVMRGSRGGREHGTSGALESREDILNGKFRGADEEPPVATCDTFDTDLPVYARDRILSGDIADLADGCDRVVDRVRLHFDLEFPKRGELLGNTNHRVHRPGGLRSVVQGQRGGLLGYRVIFDIIRDARNFEFHTHSKPPSYP